MNQLLRVLDYQLLNGVSVAIAERTAVFVNRHFHGALLKVGVDFLQISLMHELLVFDRFAAVLATTFHRWVVKNTQDAFVSTSKRIFVFPDRSFT